MDNDILFFDSDEEIEGEKISLNKILRVVNLSTLRTVSDRFKRVHLEKLYSYFALMPMQNLKASTITIGRKWIGQQSADDQYAIFRKHIKKSLAFNCKSCKYVYFAELQSNGNVHLHGIVYNMYELPYMEEVKRYGRHNTNKKSYCGIGNIRSYWTYITKEVKMNEERFPVITNLKYKSIRDLIDVDERIQNNLL